MKLQRHFAYEYNRRKHYKHVIIVPEEDVERLGWQHGQELEQRVDGDKLMLKPKGTFTESGLKGDTGNVRTREVPLEIHKKSGHGR